DPRRRADSIPDRRLGLTFRRCPEHQLECVSASCAERKEAGAFLKGVQPVFRRMRNPRPLRCPPGLSVRQWTRTRHRRIRMTPGIELASRRVRVAALLLIAGLAAGPVGTHVYWMLGGTWGLGRSTTTTGIRIVAVVVVL